MLTIACAAGRMPRVLGYGGLFAVVLTAFEYTGGSLRGWIRDPDVDEFERKETLRKNRRRPIEETIAELGEGRGELFSLLLFFFFLFCSWTSATICALLRDVTTDRRCRNPPPRLRGAATRADQGEVRHRHQDRIG